MYSFYTDFLMLFWLQVDENFDVDKCELARGPDHISHHRGSNAARVLPLVALPSRMISQCNIDARLVNQLLVGVVCLSRETRFEFLVIVRLSMEVSHPVE
jgi:hypothetical protein